MEFRMTTDLSVMQPKELAFNFEELYAAISEKTEKYRNLIVTEDGIAEAKKDRANLRKLADALNSEKIAVKKAFTRPLDEFESKVKQLIDLCKVPANEIDAQIKAYEEAKKAEKKALLEQHFMENIGDAAEYVTFEHIFDPKWLNATVLLDTAKLLIDEMCTRYKDDVSALNTMCESADTSTAYALRRAFQATKSLGNVMRVKSEIDRELRLQEERKANEEARRKALEELREREANNAPELSHARELPQVESDSTQISESENTDDAVEVCFRVRCTTEQLGALKTFLRENNIWYGRV